jgi:hypothetical protein
MGSFGGRISFAGAEADVTRTLHVWPRGKSSIRFELLVAAPGRPPQVMRGVAISEVPNDVESDSDASGAYEVREFHHRTGGCFLYFRLADPGFDRATIKEAKCERYRTAGLPFASETPLVRTGG